MGIITKTGDRISSVILSKRILSVTFSALSVREAMVSDFVMSLPAMPRSIFMNIDFDFGGKSQQNRSLCYIRQRRNENTRHAGHPSKVMALLSFLGNKIKNSWI